tara:strand:+ start:115 stop:357 length:243 start_codon:yes stop_codon:yes gene_type:complete
MDEIFNFTESPEASTIKVNTEALLHIGTVFAEIYGCAEHTRKDEALKKILIEQLCKHSNFVLSTSEKMIQNRRLEIKAVS